ncbi:MAG: DegT/DnrJ/EryC1/StrS family aminotransferase [Deltaproteobacteria bacterium]|nr:DegT/DnrJ/EryC1/StrS family aminotransferase [Candidatus Zymogenaceae bacterium]
MKVPLLDLKSQFVKIEGEIRSAVDRVLDSQYFILGPEVAQLEKEIADYTGADWGVGVASGSDAILLALMALDIGPGDAVVTTPYTFFSTAGSITRLGAVPLFVDIKSDSYNMDPSLLEKFLEGLTKKGSGYVTTDGLRVKAVMPVHLYGQMADMDPICALAEKYDLLVVEDAAQAIGAEYKGRRAGSMGDVGCFSFFPSKNLGAFGDGGMITTSSDAIREKVIMLRNHGSEPKYYHAYVGLNSRLDAIQAAVLRVKLKYLDEWSGERKKNADLYRKLFRDTGLLKPDGPITTPLELADRRHIYNQFVIRVERRDDLRTFLGDNDIGTEIYYPVPLHLQECYADLGHRAGDLPVSEAAANETLALPIYPELTDDMQRYIVEVIGEFYGK